LTFTSDAGCKALHEAIDYKCARTPVAERACTIVALDAGHSAVLIEAIDAYIQQHGEPTDIYGVASVWFVGPSELLVRRVGIAPPNRT
jgi:hypothetical protein